MIKSATALIFHNKKLLLLHRDNIPTISDPDKWGAIGGNVEEGESPDQAVRREVKEETNLSPKNIKYLGKFVMTGHEKHIYLVRLEDDEISDIHLGNEGQELKFFTFEDLETLHLGMYIGVYLNRYREQVKMLFEGIEPPASKLGLIPGSC